MIFKLIQDNRGIALLLTLSIITIVVTTALELNRNIRSSLVSTSISRDAIQLSQMNTAAVHAGMALLIKDKLKTKIDSIQEEWADPEKIAELLAILTFEEGAIEMEISDELSRIQVNALVEFPAGKKFNEAQKIMWDRMLRSIREQFETLDDPETEATAMVNSLKDWLDFGDDEAITGLNGAESEYYQDLEPPYACRNGPLRHISELALVKGFSQIFNSIGESFGLADFVTIYGIEEDKTKKGFTFPGKININTAAYPVLAAILPSENKEYAMAIFGYREEPEDDGYANALTSTTWYQKAPGCSDIKIDPKLITLSSDIFRLTVKGNLNGFNAEDIVVVRRVYDNKTGIWHCRVLSWEHK